MIRLAGADRTILGSDLGLTDAPCPVEGFRAIVASLLDEGFTAAEIRQLVGWNAAKRLDLQPAQQTAQAA